MTKSEAGRLGGRRTAEKYGRSHMAAIGRRGGIAFHQKYMLIPWRLNDFAIVNRFTKEVVNYLSGKGKNE